MKKFILLPLAFTIAMTFFSLSCFQGLITTIEDQITDVVDTTRLAVFPVNHEFTSTGVRITATTPSLTSFGTDIPSEYSYSLHYVNAALAYPTITSTNIADFPPKTGKELYDALPLLPSGSSVSTPIALGDPGAGVEITFDIIDLVADTLYLYVVQTYHPSKTNGYTSVSAEKGWFKTLP